VFLTLDWETQMSLGITNYVQFQSRLGSYQKSKAKDKTMYVKSIVDYINQCVSLHDTLGDVFDGDNVQLLHTERVVAVYGYICMTTFIEAKDWKALDMLVEGCCIDVSEIVIMAAFYCPSAMKDIVLHFPTLATNIENDPEKYTRVATSISSDELLSLAHEAKTKQLQTEMRELTVQIEKVKQLGLSQKDLAALLSSLNVK